MPPRTASKARTPTAATTTSPRATSSSPAAKKKTSSPTSTAPKKKPVSPTKATTSPKKSSSSPSTRKAASSSLLKSSSKALEQSKEKMHALNNANASDAQGKDFAASQRQQQQQPVKALRSFVNAGSVTCMCVSQLRGDLLCVGTAHGDIAVVAAEVADQVLAEEAGGNIEAVPTSNVLRNAHRKKVSAMTCDAQGNFVTGSSDGSLKLWAVDPSVSLFPVCVKTLFPEEYALELEKPFVPSREKKFEVPEVTDVVVVTGKSSTGRQASSPEDGDDHNNNNNSSNNFLTTTIYASYSDGVLRKWDADKEKCIQTVKPSYGRVTCLSVTPDGSTLCCGNDSGVVTVWHNISSIIKSPSIPLPEEPIQMLWPEPIRNLALINCFVPPTSLKNPTPAPVLLCFAGTPSGSIYGFDPATGQKKCALKHFGASGTGIGASAVVKLLQGPNCLLSAHDNGSVLIWNVLDWTPAGTIWHSAVEGKTSVLSTATIFSLTASLIDDEEGSAAAAVAAQASSSNNNNQPWSPTSRKSVVGATTVAENVTIPSAKVGLVTSTTSGSVSVWTNCVFDAITKLRLNEAQISDGVLQKLKAKRAEEMANKRRM